MACQRPLHPKAALTLTPSASSCSIPAPSQPPSVDWGLAKNSALHLDISSSAASTACSNSTLTFSGSAFCFAFLYALFLLIRLGTDLIILSVTSSSIPGSRYCLLNSSMIADSGSISVSSSSSFKDDFHNFLLLNGVGR